MLLGLHLPFGFDARLLQQDLAVAKQFPWARHFNEQEYGGIWSGIALRSATGRADDIVAAPEGRVFRDTELLALCPYFREVLAAFQCPLRSVRLLSLAPGSFIREHSDYALGYDDGEIRVHVPVQTNPGVEFYVAGERLLLEEGNSYFVNVNLPHRVNNRGNSERIHLVIDAEVNSWVRELFRQGEAECRDIPRSPLPPGNVDDFRLAVLGDEPLQKELEAIPDRGQFVRTVLERGGERGLSFHEGDIDAVWRCDPLKMARPAPAGWIPAAVTFPERRPLAEWLFAGTRRFTEPFFEDSIRVARRLPFAQFMRLQTPLEASSPADGESGEPSGFILHVSRCGSTLVSSMLGAARGHSVLSEPPPLDQVLQAPLTIGDLPREEHARWLRSMVHGLARRRSPGETRCFIKADAWHTHNFALLRAAFPATPWIFIYRDPVEVLVSQLARPALLSLPGAVDPRIFGLEFADITRLTREQFAARVLEGVFRAGLAASRDPHCLLVRYEELPEAVFGPIAKHFGLELSPEDIAAMRSVAARDAKNAGIVFQPDSESKRAGATAAIRALCEPELNGLFASMQEACRAQGGDAL